MKLREALRDHTFAEDIEDAAKLVEEQRTGKRPWDTDQPTRRRPRPKPPRRQVDPD